MRDALPPADPAWAFFLDIDGTLVELAPAPSLVQLSPAMDDAVRRMHRAAGGALALVSGRAIADMDSIFVGAPLPAAGQHGLERRNGTGVLSRLAVKAAGLQGARQLLSELVARYPALLLEDKGLSIALHYRGAPPLGPLVHRAMNEALSKAGRGYALQPGKLVVELKAAGATKGAAVRAFMREEPFRGRQPVFVGDDATDEDGFAAVNALRGVTVKVGRGATAARWRLPDVAAVEAWLSDPVIS